MSISEISKCEFLLKICFLGKVRDLSKHMGVILFDKRASKIVNTAQKISEYVSVSSVVNKLSQEYFFNKFKFENISDPLVKTYLIERLSDFDNFSSGQRQYSSMIDSRWCLKYKGEWCGPWDWKEATGFDSWNNFVNQYSETVCYFYGYEKGKELYKSFGIKTFGGGSAADYIQSGIENLKPHILEAVNYLKNL